jgi:dipeptidyl aminopeptidase/acylaminoacyl peptidase
MITRVRSLPRDATTWVVGGAIALILALVPLTLVAQAPAQTPAQEKAAAQAKPPLSWADKILQQEAYATPPPEVAAAVLTARDQNVNLSNASPDKKWFLTEIGDGPVPMTIFSKPFHELGGVFIDFKANRARALTIRNNVGIQLISAADGSKRPIQLPPGARVSNATWSPDGANVAFFVHGDDATHIWIADVATLKARQLTQKPVLATMVSTFQFTKDGKQIATVLIPDGRPPTPVAAVAPAGPQVKINDDKDRNRLRTFPSLMSTDYEFQLLEWHASGQLVLLDVQAAPAAKGAKSRPVKGAPPAGVKKIGQPAMIRSLDLSPDARYVRVTRMTKPFSYIVPVGNFGSVEEVWDADGKALAKVTERPLNLGVPDDTQPQPDPTAGPGGGAQAQQGKREVAWRADGQGLTYLEQEPAPPGEGRDAATGAAGRAGRAATTGRAAAGDQAAGRGQAPQRKDRLFQWLPPFDEKSAKVIFENNSRTSNHRFSPDMQTLFFRETSGQNTVENAVNLKEPTQRHTLARFRTDDIYANPGSLVMVRGGGGGGRGAGAPAGGRGGAVGPGGGIVQLSTDGTSVFYQGTLNDKNPEQVGPKTFIDRVAITSGEKKRIFESDNNNVYESVSTVLDPDAGRFIIERQGPTQVPQFVLAEGTSRKPLTENKDLFPDLTTAPKQRIPVTRADGIKFDVTVMLPPGYQKGTRLPAIFWFYPREFTDQEAIDRPDRTFNKNTFQNFGARSMQFLVRLGYAVVVDSPGAIPVVGPQGQQNNNYVHDLRNGLAAIIDELDRRAIIDRTRLAIGGHSYGAFTTVNAMVHTPFFKAGIAGDGAYNRTLTPMTFQSERRDLWDAKDVYLGMSPFLYANNLTGALLMYHGLHDQNVGTDPDNSIRLFHALNGLGKTTALYLYPLEDHGPAAKETLLDLWARWAAWLDKYVKNPQKPEEKKTGMD